MEIMTYLYGHESPETAYMIDGYPWGFRLKTTIRYWIESKATKNGGQRFCSQTIDPRTGKWCAPKKSTYREIEVLFLDEIGHIHVESLSFNGYGVGDGLQHAEDFKKRHEGNLNPFQLDRWRRVMAFRKVMQNVTFSCVGQEPLNLTKVMDKDPKEMEKFNARIEQERIQKENQTKNEMRIEHAINCEYAKTSALV